MFWVLLLIVFTYFDVIFAILFPLSFRNFVQMCQMAVILWFTCAYRETSTILNYFDLPFLKKYYTAVVLRVFISESTSRHSTECSTSQASTEL